MINKKRKTWHWKLADRLNLSEVRKNQWRNGFKGSTGKHWVLSEATRQRQGIAQSKEKNPMWKGGITERSWSFYQLPEYRAWRLKILERDGKKCILCGSTKKLEADHIKPRSLYLELRFDISNGRTLCHECHIQTDTYSGRVHKLVLI